MGKGVSVSAKMAQMYPTCRTKRTDRPKNPSRKGLFCLDSGRGRASPEIGSRCINCSRDGTDGGTKAYALYQAVSAHSVAQLQYSQRYNTTGKDIYPWQGGPSYRHQDKNCIANQHGLINRFRMMSTYVQSVALSEHGRSSR